MSTNHEEPSLFEEARAAAAVVAGPSDEVKLISKHVKAIASLAHDMELKDLLHLTADLLADEIHDLLGEEKVYVKVLAALRDQSYDLLVSHARWTYQDEDAGFDDDLYARAFHVPSEDVERLIAGRVLKTSGEYETPNEALHG